MKIQATKTARHLLGQISLLLTLLLIGLCIGAQTVRADIGPKPTMDFEFEIDDDLTISQGVLQECSDSTCSEAWAMEEYGPQGLSCKSTSCSSMAYGYDSDYYRLVITFSDGVTRESNSFTKSHYDANYRVTVRENDLLVEGTGGDIHPMLLILAAIVAGIGGLICGGLLMLALVIILIALIFKGGQEQASFEASRVLFVAVGIITLPFFVVGSFFSLALPLTAIIEGLVAFVYATVQKRPRFTLLTLVTLANLISQPCLWFIVFRADDVSLMYLGVGECFIWLLEAVLLYVWQRKILSFKESLGLSLLLNAFSFAIGLLLPL